MFTVTFTESQYNAAVAAVVNNVGDCCEIIAAGVTDLEYGKQVLREAFASVTALDALLPEWPDIDPDLRDTINMMRTYANMMRTF